MNVLVTGCKGQLGNELRFIFESGKSEVGELSQNLLQDINADYIDIEELDITNLDDTIAKVKDVNADVIINCAAYTNVDACESNLDVAMKVNALGPRNLAIAAEKVGAKLIHVSTDYVFEGNGSKPYVEWDIKDPQSVYGTSKSLGEEYVKEFCSKHFIIRTAWLYGLIGKNFVKTMLNLGKTKEQIKVVDDQRGNPTNAADLAYHIVKLLNTDEYGIYHCTCKGECSWYDFTKKIFEYAGLNKVEVLPCASDEFPSPTKRPTYSSLDNMMLRATVGDDTREWQDALKVYIDNLKKRGEI